MIALKASLLVGSAWSVAVLMRGRSAATRHALLAAAFGCAGALPLIESIAPGWGTTIGRLRCSLSVGSLRVGDWDMIFSVGWVQRLAAVFVASLRRGR